MAFPKSIFKPIKSTMLFTENLADCLENPSDNLLKLEERIDKAILFLVDRK